jgi:hypothetical protein
MVVRQENRSRCGSSCSFIALAVAIWASLHYPGTLDRLMHDYFHINAGSAHISATPPAGRPSASWRR